MTYLLRRISIILLLVALGAVAVADDTKGEVRVILIFNQTTGPMMLNKIQADIGVGGDNAETWVRGATAKKELPPDTYSIVAKKAEVCSFGNCVPCPDQKQDVDVKPAGKSDVVFRWKAHYDRVEKKWVCE